MDSLVKRAKQLVLKGVYLAERQELTRGNAPSTIDPKSVLRVSAQGF